MPIQTVSTSNTFNEWRVTTNELVAEVNKTANGIAQLTVDTLAANTVSAVTLTATGDVNANNVVITGQLQGPSTLYIDPATVGDNTGTVVIKGNLQIDGTTTTVNSTSVSVDDLNITLAADAANAAAANGAGFTVAGANATFLYLSATDAFNLNKDVVVEGDLAVNGGDLTTTQTTFNLANTTATTVNFAGAGTTVNVGANTGTTTIRNDLAVTGTTSLTGNVTLSGELRGPSTFTIDPAVVGDDTGTVVIKGNLQIDGTTTTINSTTLTVDDKNIVVASGAANAAAADGAGLTVDGASATLLYTSSTDSFNFNKDVVTSGDFAVNGGDVTTTSSTFNIANTNATTVWAGGAATALNLGATTGTTTVRNNLSVSGNTAVTGTTTVTGVATFQADSRFTSTGAVLISKGSSGQQPGSPEVGMLRYNTTTGEFEGYSGASPSWKSVGGSAITNDTSTASDLYPAFLGDTANTALNIYTSNSKLLYKPSTGEFKAEQVVAQNGLFVNSTIIDANYTVAANTNAFSVGPITVASGAAVTVSSGQRWVVI